MKKLKNIKVLIWDIDGTLWHNQKAFDFIKQKEWQIYARCKKIDFKKAKEEVEKRRETYKSRTMVLVKSGCGSYKDLLYQTDGVITSQFLKKDKKLQEMFKNLPSYTHIILANKTKVAALRQLSWLGIPKKIFSAILTIEDFKETKPSLLPFQAVLTFTRLPASVHLMIGDREEVDLVPAKKLGMKTCLVGKKGEIADFSVKEVYEIEKYL